MLLINDHISGRETEVGSLVKRASFRLFVILINNFGLHFTILRGWQEITPYWIWLKMRGDLIDKDNSSFLTGRQIKHRARGWADMPGIFACVMPLSSPSTVHKSYFGGGKSSDGLIVELIGKILSPSKDDIQVGV